MIPEPWFSYLNFAAMGSPLITLAAAVVVFLRRGQVKNGSGRRSLGLFVLGFAGVGALFYVLGFWLGSYLSCRQAKYAECVLGGLILVGPLGFSFATGAYLYLWGQNGKAP